MRARDLRPCDWCGKQLAGRMPDGHLTIQFYVVTLATAILDQQAVSQHMGLALLTGSAQLAEVFTSKPDVALIVEDQPGAGGRDEALLCFNCWIGHGEPAVRLSSFAERIAERKARAQAEAESTAAARTKADAPPPTTKKRARPAPAAAHEEAE